MRSARAVFIGFVTVALASVVTDALLHATGIMPDGPLFDVPLVVLALGYRTLYTVLGAYVTARLAPSHPLRHALLLGAIGMIPATAGAILLRDLGPAWYAWGLVVEALPCAWLGGWLYARGRAHA